MLGELTVTIKENYGGNQELLRGNVFTKGKVYPVIHAMEIQAELFFLVIDNNKNFMHLSINRVNPVNYIPMYEHLTNLVPKNASQKSVTK